MMSPRPVHNACKLCKTLHVTKNFWKDFGGHSQVRKQVWVAEVRKYFSYIKTVISIKTGDLYTASSSVPLSLGAVCTLSLHSGFLTWRLCSNSVFEILVSLRYKKWFEDARPYE